MTNNLKAKTAISAVWNLLDRSGQQFIYLVTGIVLARTLAVEDYALVGMLSIFIALSTIFIDSGFTSAFIREKTIDPKDFSALWGFNILLSIGIYAGLFVAAPLIAGFYKQPALTALSRCMFLALPINAMGIVQNIQLNRRVDFRTLAKINVSALLVSGSLAIIMALTGWGVWALAMQPVLLSITKSGMLWAHRSRPIVPTFKFGRLKKYVSYTINTLFTTLLTTLFNNTYYTLIGRHFSKLDMGYYTQANKYAEIPNSISIGPIQSITFAAFAQIQDDAERLQRAARKSFRTVCFFVFPLMLGLVAVSRPLFLILLGSKWANIIPFLQLICIANIFTNLTALNGTLLNLKGLANIVLRLEVVKLTLFFISLFFTFRYGITAMLYGLIVVRMISFLITAFFAGKKMNYPVSVQLRDMLPYLGISLLMFAACFAWTFVLDNHFLLLAVQLTTGGLVYVGMNEWLGSKVYKDIREMVTEQLRKLKS